MRPARIATIVVALGLVGGVVVGADRLLAQAAEHRISAAIEQNLDGVTGSPRITIGGFPFLTQVAHGSLARVSGTIAGATLSDVAAQDVTFDGRDVSTARPYTIGTATLSATLPVSSLARLVDERTGLTIDLAVVDGALRASGSILGLPLSADVRPGTRGGDLVVDLEQVTLGGLAVSTDDLPGVVGDRLRDLRIPVTGLPDGLGLSAARVVPDGLRITAEGTDVELPGS